MWEDFLDWWEDIGWLIVVTVGFVAVAVGLTWWGIANIETREEYSYRKGQEVAIAFNLQLEQDCREAATKVDLEDYSMIDYVNGCLDYVKGVK